MHVPFFEYNIYSLWFTENKTCDKLDSNELFTTYVNSIWITCRSRLLLFSISNILVLHFFKNKINIFIFRYEFIYFLLRNFLYQISWTQLLSWEILIISANLLSYLINITFKIRSLSVEYIRIISRSKNSLSLTAWFKYEIILSN